MRAHWCCHYVYKLWLHSSAQLLMIYKYAFKAVLIYSEACLWDDEEPPWVSTYLLCGENQLRLIYSCSYSSIQTLS